MSETIVPARDAELAQVRDERDRWRYEQMHMLKEAIARAEAAEAQLAQVREAATRVVEIRTQMHDAAKENDTLRIASLVTAEIKADDALADALSATPPATEPLRERLEALAAERQNVLDCLANKPGAMPTTELAVAVEEMRQATVDEVLPAAALAYRVLMSGTLAIAGYKARHQEAIEGLRKWLKENDYTEGVERVKRRLEKLTAALAPAGKGVEP